MSIYILEYPITDEIIVKFFDRLCVCRVREKIGYYPDQQFGFESGYVFCLTDLFGQCPDEDNAKAFFKGESYIDVVEEIVDKYLVVTIDAYKNSPDAELINALETIDKVVSLSVRDYAKQNFEKMRKAFKSL